MVSPIKGRRQVFASTIQRSVCGQLPNGWMDSKIHAPVGTELDERDQRASLHVTSRPSSRFGVGRVQHIGRFPEWQSNLPRCSRCTSPRATSTRQNSLSRNSIPFRNAAMGHEHQVRSVAQIWTECLVGREREGPKSQRHRARRRANTSSGGVPGSGPRCLSRKTSRTRSSPSIRRDQVGQLVDDFLLLLGRRASHLGPPLAFNRRPGSEAAGRCRHPVRCPWTPRAGRPGWRSAGPATHRRRRRSRHHRRPRSARLPW